MTDRPMIFTAPMVRAGLSGAKTQHRVPMTPRNTLFDGRKWPTYMSPDQFHWTRAWVDAGPSPAGNPGPYLKLPVTNIEMVRDGTEETVHRIYPKVQVVDGVWVKEAFRALPHSDGWKPSELLSGEDLQYPADEPLLQWNSRYRSAVSMPRWASRITLTVTAVRVERVQDISRGDAMSEGCPFANMADGPSPRDWYADIWNTIHGPGAWEANPWVQVMIFTTKHGNIDSMEDGK